VSVEVGSAVLTIIPSARGLRGKMEQEITADAVGASRSAGEASGRSFVGRFTAVVAAGIAAGGVLLFRGVIAGLKATVMPASDLNETISKTGVIFGANAGAVQTWAATANTSMGLTRRQALENAASFGDMFQQIKIAPALSRNMSTGLVNLATDLASFHNADITQVLDAQAAAFRGEYDSLQRYVPAINAARVEQEALRLTHKRSAKDLTAADKALATYQILMKDTAAAQGDFARTSGGLANQARILSAQWGDFKVRIGTALLPVVTQFVATLNTKLMPALNALWAQHGPAVTAWLSQAAAKAGPLVDKLASFDWKGFGADVGAAFGKLGPQLKTLGEAAGTGFVDTLHVGAVVMQFAAEHADLLAKALPYLAAGFLLVKTAQASETAVAAVRMPLRVAELVIQHRQNVALRAHTAALIANTAASRVGTAATVADTAATNVGFFARARATTGMIAHRVASIAVAAAAKAWTVAQWLLNVALTANPIGLIVAAIALLVIGFVLAWKHSETFRKVVTAAFGFSTAAVRAFVTWVVGTAWPWLKRTWEQVSGLAVGVYRSWKANLDKVVDFIRGIPRSIADLGAALYDKGRDLIQGFINGIRTMPGKVRDALLDLLPGPLKQFAGKIGLASPSKLFERYGRLTVAGFILGIERSRAGVAAAMAALVPAPPPAPAGAYAPAASAASAAAGGITQNIYGTPGQSLAELVAAVKRELLWETGG